MKNTYYSCQFSGKLVSDQIQVHACLDQVENLGDFLELEIVVGDESDRDRALVKIMLILQKFNLKQKGVSTIEGTDSFRIFRI